MNIAGVLFALAFFSSGVAACGLLPIVQLSPSATLSSPGATADLTLEVTSADPSGCECQAVFLSSSATLAKEKIFLCPSQTERVAIEIPVPGATKAGDVLEVAATVRTVQGGQLVSSNVFVEEALPPRLDEKEIPLSGRVVHAVESNGAVVAGLVVLALCAFAFVRR